MQPSVPVRVDSVGKPDGKGGITLDQTIREGSKPPRQRRWVLRQTSPTTLAGTVTDTPGPIRGRMKNGRLHLNYTMKGGMKAEQVLTLQPGGRVVINRMTVAQVRHSRRPCRGSHHQARLSLARRVRPAIPWQPKGSRMNATTEQKPWSMARVVTASSAGTAFEWYDFFIFGSAHPGHRQGVPRRARPDLGADRRAGPVRGRLRLPPAGRDHLRRDGRPRRAQGDLPHHRQPDGRRDLRHRPAADLCQRRHPRPDPARLPAHLPGHRAWAANMAARRSTSPSMPRTASAARRPAGSSRRPRSACSPLCW